MRDGRSGPTTARVLVVVAAVAAFQCLIVAGATPASATPSCSFNGGTLTITDDGAGWDLIVVWQDTDNRVFAAIGPPVALTAPGSLCGSAISLTTLQTVVIIGGTGLTLVEIAMARAAVADPPSPPSPGFPGGNPAGPAADWGTVDWTIDLTANLSPVAGLGVFGSAIGVINASRTDPMHVTAGTSGVDLDNDGRLDVAVEGTPLYVMSTMDRSGSVMSGGGSAATGAPLTAPMSVQGGPGADAIRGGDGRDLVIGSAGDDSITGGAGPDFLLGGAGADAIDGGRGNDTILGNAGDDTIRGGVGRDTCLGDPGHDSVHCEATTGVVIVIGAGSGPSAEGLDRAIPWWPARRVAAALR